MIDRSRVVGVAIVIVAAIGGGLPPLAQATETPEFTAGPGTAAKVQNVTVEGTASTTQTLHFFGITTNCSHVALHGTNAVPSNTATITPTYSGCTSAGSFPATVTMNGCDYLLHLEKTEIGTDAYIGSTDIVCGAGKGMEISVFLAGKDEGTPSCVVRIGAQNGLKTLTFKVDTGTPHDITLSGTVGKISATQTRNSFLCPTGTSTTEGMSTPPPITLRARSDDVASSLTDFWID